MKFPLPRVTRSTSTKSGDFPVKHYSASSLVLFGSNPIMFKLLYVNRQTIDSTNGISSVIGRAFHKAMETYYGGNDEVTVANEAEAIEWGLKVGLDFLDRYNDGWIKWSSKVENKQKAQEIFAFAFNAYVKEMPYDNGDQLLSVEDEFNEQIAVEWKDRKVDLPVKLKGFTDKVVRRDGKVKVIDYKTCDKFSDPEKIDGAKMIQAVQYYFGVYAKLGEAPYSMIFEEVKKTKNREGGPQVQQYEIVYAENELFFDFYFRYYEDVTLALMGKQVYVPNVHAMFDGDIAIIAYIHRLDDDIEIAKQMKALKVDNITDVLKKKIQSASSMKKFLLTVEKEFISAKNLNYDKMKPEEKIQTKLMEHGMMLSFDSKVTGHAFDLYQYTPSIGLKMKKLEGYTADVEQVLGVSGIRILAPIPNTTFVGFEVPRGERTFPDGTAQGHGYNLAIGVDVMGKPYHFDITQAPHMLVAGATGSGKSVFLNSVITQLTNVAGTELYLCDPKIVELAHFKGKPNVAQYEREPMAILELLKKQVEEMDARYKQLADRGVRSIAECSDMARRFIIIDEFGDLIAQNHVHEESKVVGQYQRGQFAGQDKVEIEKLEISKEISNNILILSQKARAAGIHMVITTQSPRVNIINGNIKSNFPTKAVFRTAQAVDSLVVLDELGAEKLLGKGDMIFTSSEGTVRLQAYRG